MKSKDKKLSKKIIVIPISIIIFITILIYYLYTNKQVSFATSSKETTEMIKFSNAELVDIDKIIEKNTKNIGTREEITTQKEELEYITTYKNNEELPKGMIQVVQEGRNGVQEISIQKVYDNDEVISENQIGAKVVKASVNKVVEIGSANYASNYKVKVGDILYVTSDRLSVMLENNLESKKISTILKNTEAKLLEVQGEWYRISADGITGWVKSECMTYINPNATAQENEQSYGGLNKAQLISKLSFNMPLNKPSGLSLEQFKKVLTDDKDKNKIFINNAEYFYYAEKQYNINGIFVAAVGIHESAWGTSRISQNKCNLFGYGAYDSNPYNGAYNFSNYSESIDLVSRVFVKYYINPAGTKIFDGQTASGKYYSGSSVSAINKRYASDKNWANAVYKYMQYLYNKL